MTCRLSLRGLRDPSVLTFRHPLQIRWSHWCCISLPQNSQEKRTNERTPVNYVSSELNRLWTLANNNQRHFQHRAIRYAESSLVCDCACMERCFVCVRCLWRGVLVIQYCIFEAVKLYFLLIWHVERRRIGEWEFKKSNSVSSITFMVLF